MKKLCVIIGAMKAGTTSLFTHLDSHPDICGCSLKESMFFAVDDLYERGMEYYRDLFPMEAGSHCYGLDASTDYTKMPYCPGVADRLRAFDGQLKLIYLLRHPLRRIESHARHVQRARRDLPRVPLYENDQSLDAGVSEVNINISRYAMQLDEYEDFYDNGQLLIVVFEDLVKTPLRELSKIASFLEISEAPLLHEFEQKNPRPTHRVNRIRPGWRLLSAIKPLRRLYRDLLPEAARSYLRSRHAVEREPLTGRFKLNPDEERQLQSELRDDLIRLRDRYGVDAESTWGISLS